MSEVCNDLISACEKFNAVVNSSLVCVWVPPVMLYGIVLPVTVGQMTTSSVPEAKTRALQLTVHRELSHRFHCLVFTVSCGR